MYLSLLFDVEDIVVPEADDIARTVAEIMTAEEVPATFCIVGERARQWRDRGRTDVVEALGRHDVAFHTDLHSVHPTVAEYLVDKGWTDGIAEAVRRDAPGVRAIREVFGVAPSCWGGPGDTWGPQVHEAMRRLDVPAVGYAHTRVPRGDIHRFCGLLSYPAGPSMPDRLYHDTPAWEARLASLLAELAADQTAGRQWNQVFMGHPTRILHEEFWDAPNFGQGRNPPPERWVFPRRKSDAALALALANLRQTAGALKRLPGVRLRTIRQMNDLAAAASEEPLTADELSDVAPVIDRNLASMSDWPILPPGFDTEPLRALTHTRLPSLRRLRLPS